MYSRDFSRWRCSAIKKRVLDVNFLEKDPEHRTRLFLGAENLKKVQETKVLVVGAGAIGNEVIKNLLLLGVREIHVVDFDKVTESNLNRCVLFTPDDVGLPKVTAIANKKGWFAFDNTIIPYNSRVEDLSESVWEQIDLVIIGVDNDAARFWCNAQILAQERIIPYINGAMARDFIDFSVHVPPYTSCLVCSWREDHLKHVQKVFASCDEFFEQVVPKFPTISTYTSIVGGFMSHMAIEVIVHGDEWTQNVDFATKNSPLGKYFRFNFNTWQMETAYIMPNPQCIEPFCRKKRE